MTKMSIGRREERGKFKRAHVNRKIDIFYVSMIIEVKYWYTLIAATYLRHVENAISLYM